MVFIEYIYALRVHSPPGLLSLFMFMKYLLKTTPLFILTFFILTNLLLGCGGGGGEKKPTKPQPEKSRSADIVEAPHEKCSVVVTGEDNAGVRYRLLSESDYTGDIKFNCSYDEEKQPTAQQYFLVNGVPSLNIVQVHRTTKISSDCTLDNASYTDSLTVDFNYKAGLVSTTVKSTANGNSSCTSKYKSPLPTTVASNESILTLFDTWGVDVSNANKSKSGLIETDCPQTPTKTSNTEVPVCKTTISNHYTVTDDTGKIHTLEKKVSF